MTLAHGVGGAGDLPLPLDLVLQGAGVALLVSFLALGLGRRRPLFRGGAAGRPLPAAATTAVDIAVRVAAPVLRVGMLIVLAQVVAIGLLGRQDVANPAPYVLWVLVWVGVPLLSAVTGPVWRLLDPLLLIPGRRERVRDGAPTGWPAAAMLLVVVWLELAAPGGGEPRVVAAAVVAYALVVAVRPAADGFGAYADLLARLAPVGRRDDGVLVLRSPFDGLAALPPARGTVALVAVLLGSTAFDSLSDTTGWAALLRALPVPAAVVATAGLLVVVAVVGGAYLAATGRHAAGLAHSMVPIVCGYVVAHYLTSLLVEGPLAVLLLLRSWGLTGLTIDAVVLPAAAVAWVQVGAVVAGHVAGVVAAHDRSLVLLAPDRRLIGQLPLVLLMVGVTIGGLLLLLSS